MNKFLEKNLKVFVKSLVKGWGKDVEICFKKYKNELYILKML